MVRRWSFKFFFITYAIGVLVCTFNSCGFIHQPAAPLNTTNLASSFSHDGITASCSSCHATGAAFSAFPASGHVDIAAQDCSACHNTTSWISNADPHTPGAPIPSQCISCHISNRPTGPQGSVGLANNLTPTGGLFDHAGNGGTGDCVTCHVSVPANVGVTWAGGIFGHSPTPTQCLGCHTTAQVPTGSVGSPPFDHSTTTADCGSCHNNPANIGRTWAEAAFTHSPVPATCASCHSSDTSYTAIQNSIRNQMFHALANLPDCATCHTSAASASGFTSWVVESIANGTNTTLSKLGVFHTNFNSNSLSTCQSCHSNERPVGPVGSPSFDHANGGTGDCVSCHKISGNIGMTWAGAQAVPATVSIPPPTGSSGWPTLAVPHPTINTANAGESCTSCHGTTAALGQLVGYDHNNGFALDSSVGCFYCHGTGQKVVGSASNFTTGPLSNNVHKSNTVTSTTTCQSCHEHSGTTYPKWSGKAFTGGSGI